MNAPPCPTCKTPVPTTELTCMVCKSRASVVPAAPERVVVEHGDHCEHCIVVDVSMYQSHASPAHVYATNDGAAVTLMADGDKQVECRRNSALWTSAVEAAFLQLGDLAH